MGTKPAFMESEIKDPTYSTLKPSSSSLSLAPDLSDKNLQAIGVLKSSNSDAAWITSSSSQTRFSKGPKKMTRTSSTQLFF
jgi:hypothetical protein